MDNPVGTGYSYVDDLNLLTTNVSEIAQDLVELFTEFLEGHPIFQVEWHQIAFHFLLSFLRVGTSILYIQ